MGLLLPWVESFHSVSVLNRFSDRRALAAAAPFLPIIALEIVWFIWCLGEGSFFPREWYPAALLAVGLVAVVAVARGASLPAGRLPRAAIGLFAALIAFNYLSILWAAAPGDALESANQLLLYGLTAWIAVTTPWTSRSLAMLLGGWVILVVVSCAIAFIGATGAGANVASYFADERYASPLHYPNATGALAALALLPALALASRRVIGTPWRLVFLGVAAFLAQFAVMPQSRGTIVGSLVAVVVLCLVSSERRRLIPRVVLVGLPLAATGSRLLAVNLAVSSGDAVGPPLREALRVALLATFAVVVAGAALELAELRVGARPRLRSGARRAAPIAAAVLLVGVIGAGAVKGHSVVHWASSEWDRAKSTDAGGGTRIVSAAPEERHDYARVALSLFRDHPVAGVGSGNFGRGYDARKHELKHSKYTHMIFLRVLSETGLVGALLFLGMLGTLLAGLIRARARLDPLGQGGVAVALAVGVYFLVHGSLDWIDQFPVLAGFVTAACFAAIATGAPHAVAAPAAGRSRGVRLAWAGAGALGVVLALVALVPAYLSVRYTDRALGSYRAAPENAIRDLDRAARLNPLSDDPLVLKGSLEALQHRPAPARKAFEDALGRAPNWYSWLEIGLLDMQAGRFGAARAALDRASRLDANDEDLKAAFAVLAKRRRIDPAVFIAEREADPLYRSKRVH
jgi:O-Antigen ligase